MNDTARRVTRTSAQLGLAAAILAFVNAFSPTALTPAQVGALGALLTILVSTAQNLLEEQGAIPPILKGPAPRPAASDRTTQRELVALASAVADLRATLNEDRADRARPARHPAAHADPPGGKPPGG